MPGARYRPCRQGKAIIVFSSARPALARAPAMAYTLSVRDSLSTISMPLRPDDPEPTLPLDQLLHDLYEHARYDLAVDYSQPPVPPWRDDDLAWARQLLATQ